MFLNNHRIPELPGIGKVETFNIDLLQTRLHEKMIEPIRQSTPTGLFINESDTGLKFLAAT